MWFVRMGPSRQGCKGRKTRERERDFGRGWKHRSRLCVCVCVNGVVSESQTLKLTSTSGNEFMILPPIGHHATFLCIARLSLSLYLSRSILPAPSLSPQRRLRISLPYVWLVSNQHLAQICQQKHTHIHTQEISPSSSPCLTFIMIHGDRSRRHMKITAVSFIFSRNMIR